MSPPAPLRIVMTADAVGGVWIFATSLARELCRRGCAVTLVTLGPAPRRDQLDSLKDVDGLAVEITDLELEWLDPQGRDFARARETLAAIAHRAAPDVVHLNSYREGVAAWNAPVAVTAHSCVRSWWRACRGTDSDEPRWRNYAANVRSGLAAADAWIAPTRAFGATVERLYQPPTPGRTIWNGLDAPSSGAEKQPFILAAGRMWDEAKNIGVLVRIAGRLPWPLQVAGPLAAPDASKAEIDVSSLIAVGELPHNRLLETMRRAAIFAAPALYEPFGLTVLEAAAAGCALVLSDIPSFRELWEGAALFVDAQDEAAWVTALSHLSRDERLRRRLQRRAGERARRYALRSTAVRYLECYRALAQRASFTARPRPGQLAEARA